MLSLNNIHQIFLIHCLKCLFYMNVSVNCIHVIVDACLFSTLACEMEAKVLMKRACFVNS